MDQCGSEQAGDSLKECDEEVECIHKKRRSGMYHSGMPVAISVSFPGTVSQALPGMRDDKGNIDMCAAEFSESISVSQPVPDCDYHCDISDFSGEMVYWEKRRADSFMCFHAAAPGTMVYLHCLKYGKNSACA